jgi:hypothetical protein
MLSFYTSFYSFRYLKRYNYGGFRGLIYGSSFYPLLSFTFVFRLLFYHSKQLVSGGESLVQYIAAVNGNHILD